jgi:hypothetical protein
MRARMDTTSHFSYTNGKWHNKQRSSAWWHGAFKNKVIMVEVEGSLALFATSKTIESFAWKNNKRIKYKHNAATIVGDSETVRANNTSDKLLLQLLLCILLNMVDEGMGVTVWVTIYVAAILLKRAETTEQWWITAEHIGAGVIAAHATTMHPKTKMTVAMLTLVTMNAMYAALNGYQQVLTPIRRMLTWRPTLRIPTND